MAETRIGRPSQVAPAPRLAAKSLPGDRVVDHADDEFAGMFEGDRDAPEREAVGEVDRPVEGIDHPPPGVGGVGDDAIFLGEDGVVGELGQQGGGDQALAGRVGRGDEVAGLLLAGGDPAVVVEEEPPAATAARSATTRYGE